MTIKKLQKLFKDAGILNYKNGRKHCYLKILNEHKDLLKLWKSFCKNYRTEDEAWFCLSHLISKPPKCPICGKLCKFTGVTKYGGTGYNTTCGECSANAVPKKIENFKNSISKKTDLDRQNSFEKRKRTNALRYGDENATLYGSKSFKENLKEKYGDENYHNKEQVEQTCLKKYGVKSNLIVQSNPKKVWEEQHEQLLEKRKQTSLERYGTDSPNQNTDVQEKMQKTKQLNNTKFEKENNCTSMGKLVRLYGQGWKTASLGLRYIHNCGRTYVDNKDIKIIKQYWEEGHCHTNSYTSKPEKELVDFIKSFYHKKLIENDTSTVSNMNHRYFELDIYLPKEHIAIDFDGIYYHSTKFKDKYYHQRKTLCCYNAGIRLAHVTEYDWNNNRKKIEKKLKQLILNHKSFNDGFFPTFKIDNPKLSVPHIHYFGEHKYYDTGVIK